MRLPALQYRGFREFLVGSFISNLGNQVQAWAIAWQVYQLTDSSLYVGLLGIARVVPLLIFSLFGGVLADHADRRKVILVAQCGLAAVAVGVAMLTITSRVTVWSLYALVALGAVARAFEGPARQAMVAGLVPKEVFPNAASLNGVTWRLSDVTGPIVAGLLIGWQGWAGISGLASCYLVNAVSFLAVLLAIYRLPPRPPEGDVGDRPRTVREVFQRIGEGFTFVKGTPVVRHAMWIDFWATFFSAADALLPAFAGPILKLGPTGYGLLAASSGLGALIAALGLAWLPTVHHQGRLVIVMIACYGLFTIGFGLAPNLPLAMLFLALTGASDMISTVMRQTIRQLADDPAAGDPGRDARPDDRDGDALPHHRPPARRLRGGRGGEVHRRASGGRDRWRDEPAGGGALDAGQSAPRLHPSLGSLACAEATALYYRSNDKQPIISSR